MSEESTSEEVVVPFPDIVGKRIVVFCDSGYDEQYLEFKLRKRYEETEGGKGTRKTEGGNDEFEVIYFKGGGHEEAVPWLIPCPCRGNAIHELARILYYSYGILVFEADGRVVRATSSPGFEDGAFPFYAGSIEEVRRDLMENFKWDYGDAIFRS
ncbi:hypothetical protein POM88_009219 [Heracleum sosnowskyi]|uniref:Uncharacterized protein n=1 Tax=Heracleum sosnowskyi TaxID=360622 RepID=A0AAD8JB35_9APIA|nr:hypothetical protein POM88_009219 [Heracleum sosnowskyi]